VSIMALALKMICDLFRLARTVQRRDGQMARRARRARR
jgi:hypothetical protein